MGSPSANFKATPDKQPDLPLLLCYGFVASDTSHGSYIISRIVCISFDNRFYFDLTASGVAFAATLPIVC